MTRKSIVVNRQVVAEMACGYIISHDLDHRTKHDRFFTRQQIIAQALITIINYYSVTNNYMFRSIMTEKDRVV